MRAKGSASTIHDGHPAPITGRDKSKGKSGIVDLSELQAKEANLSERRGQTVAFVLEIARQTAKARSREARRKSAVADSG
jgi:hypothetical protein